LERSAVDQLTELIAALNAPWWSLATSTKPTKW